MTTEEQQIVNLIARRLEQAQGKAKAVTNAEIRKYLSQYNHFVLDRKIRDVVMRLRLSGRVKMLCATTAKGKKNGYYVATDRVEAWDYVKRMKSRLDNISKTHAALVRQFHQAFNLTIPFEETLSPEVIISMGFRKTIDPAIFVMDRSEFGGFTLHLKKGQDPNATTYGIFKNSTFITICNTRGELDNAVQFLSKTQPK